MIKYIVIVTNQPMPTIQIWEQYKGRGDSENRIKELKEDFAVGSRIKKEGEKLILNLSLPLKRRQ